MNKLTAIRIKYSDGRYSDEIPVSVLAENVRWGNGNLNLTEVLGNVKVTTAGTVQEQIDALANEKIDSQQLDNYIATQLSEATTAWLNQHISQIGSTIILDTSLKIEGAAADAKAVGDNINEVMQTVSDELAEKVDNGYVEDGIAYFRSGDDVLFSITGIGGGGDGSGDSQTVLTLTNTSGWATKVMGDSGTCLISFNWSSILEGSGSTGNGTLMVSVKGSTVINRPIAQGDCTLDLTEYLTAGSNRIKVTVIDAYNTTKSLILTVSVVSLRVASSYDESQVQTSAFYVPYVVTGTGEKTVHFLIDNVSKGTISISTSGRQSTYTCQALNHGAHKLEIYAVTTIDGAEIESNHVVLSVIAITEGQTTPIIASSYDASTVAQFDQIVIPYYVYSPSSMTSSIDIYINNELYSSQTVDRREQKITYRARTVGSLKIDIKCGTVTKTFNLTVAQSEADIYPETDGLSLYLTTEGRSNNEANPATWTFENIEASMIGFNFASDGWVLDTNNNTILRVSGDARVEIPYKIFSNNFAAGYGKTIEVEFETHDVRNYDAEIITCWNNNRGLKITAQKAILQSEGTVLSTQYKEDEHIRVSFVITPSSTNRLVYVYIDGIMSGVIQYPPNDNFAQGAPVGITIGSSDCTVDIYNIRIYDKPLDHSHIVTNWIADTQDVSEMLERYERNNIFDAYGNIVIDQLPTNLPYLVLEGPSLPPSKGEKRTMSGYYVDPQDASKSFTFENASCDVQGTSSQGYPRKNYKIKYKTMYDSNGQEISGYRLRGDKSLPSKVFCYKADYASSEGANNVELVRLYNDACPVLTPPQQDNALIQQGIDGVPIIIFWTNTENNTTSFLGKYNFNHDKSSPVFGFRDGDESWETKDNSNDWALFKKADYTTTEWYNAYEPRFPDVDTKDSDPTNLAALAAWICSTDREQATNAAITPITYEGVQYTTDSSAYRLAKFRNELTNHFVKDDVLYYYLFTELFLMIDSRVKNSFPTLYASNQGAKWMLLPYDMDTAIGINNEGKLVFDYSLEDTDMLSETAGVYNGYKTVMWNNVRDAFSQELASMYVNLRAAGTISYEVIEKRFEDHQSAWSENIFNEDAYFKYIEPLITTGEDNLKMCLGSKSSQRKWWLYNRFRYIDSKYNTGYARTSYIQARVYQKSNLTITPYADIYAAAAFDENLVKERAARNTAVTIASPTTWNPGGSDAVLRIYSADQLKSLGDLSSFYVGEISFAAAIKLQDIKLGDANSSYKNYNLESLTLGNNVLLRSIDVRNCPNLRQAVDLSGCTNIEQIYFDGTSVTGVTLPNGGIINTLHLPGTITSLIILNQSKITNFVLPDYSQITTLWVENSSINELPILLGIPDNSRVRLTNVSWHTTTYDEVEALLAKLDTCFGFGADSSNNPAELSGELYAEVISDYHLELLEQWPDLHVTYDEVITHKWLLNQYILDEIDDYTGVSFITKLAPRAFYYKHGALSLPNVRTLDQPEIFYGFKTDFSLREVLPNLETIGASNLFQYSVLSGLDSVSLTGTLIPPSGSSYVYLFSQMSNLKYVYFPNLVISGDYRHEFDGDFKIEYVVMPKTNEIRAGLGNMLKFLDILTGTLFTVTATSQLRHFVIRSETKVAKCTNAINLEDATLNVYVPRVLLDSYKSATNWSSYYAQGKVDFKAIEDYTVDGTTTGEFDYDKIGLEVYHNG